MSKDLGNIITLDLNEMEDGYDGVSKQEYLWKFLDDPDSDNIYEVRIIKMDIPKESKELRGHLRLGTKLN
jgi:hypothetical protein